IGITGMGLAPGWSSFAVLALPAGLGGGALDGGSNGLFLDLFRSGRGRAMNLLHLFFSFGALSAPLVIGALVDSGVRWQVIVSGTGLALLPLAAVFGLVSMPSGRNRVDPAVGTAASPGQGSALAAAVGSSGGGTTARRVALPLVLLGIGILTY